MSTAEKLPKSKKFDRVDTGLKILRDNRRRAKAEETIGRARRTKVESPAKPTLKEKPQKRVVELRQELGISSSSIEEEREVIEKTELPKRIEGKPYKLFKEAPNLPPEAFWTNLDPVTQKPTKESIYVDFTHAESLPELINLIREVGEIQNSNGQTIEADTLINLIYDRLYNPGADWSKITLRHRLRETVYTLLHKYQQQPEYLNNLGQVGFLNIKNLDQLKANVLHSNWALASGKIVTGEQVVGMINEGDIINLPAPIKYQVISLNKASLKTPPSAPEPKSWYGRLTKRIGKLFG